MQIIITEILQEFGVASSDGQGFQPSHVDTALSDQIPNHSRHFVFVGEVKPPCLAGELEQQRLDWHLRVR